MYYLEHTYTWKTYLLTMWNSNLTECPVLIDFFFFLVDLATLRDFFHPTLLCSPKILFSWAFFPISLPSLRTVISSPSTLFWGVLSLSGFELWWEAPGFCIKGLRVTHASGEIGRGPIWIHFFWYSTLNKYSFELSLPSPSGTSKPHLGNSNTTYWYLRRNGSNDFKILSPATF